MIFQDRVETSALSEYEPTAKYELSVRYVETSSANDVLEKSHRGSPPFRYPVAARLFSTPGSPPSSKSAHLQPKKTLKTKKNKKSL